MHYVYILKSKKNNQLYIGSTNNLKRRFVEHNNGKEISTKRYTPWELLYYEAYQSEKDAREREMKLKNHGNAIRELKKRIEFFSRIKSGAGFTLIEVIVAISLVTVGVVGASTLIQQTISYTSISSSRLVASYLAQEGIEIVRNIRDTNWLEQRTTPAISWDEGLLAGDWEADYQTQNLTQPFIGGQYLNLDTNNFYSYSLGEATKFKRKITITPQGSDTLEISVEVSWQERGRTHKVTVQGNLYKWR